MPVYNIQNWLMWTDVIRIHHTLNYRWWICIINLFPKNQYKYVVHCTYHFEALSQDSSIFGFSMRNNSNVNKLLWEITICWWIAKWKYDPETSIDYSRFVENAWYGFINNANITWTDRLLLLLSFAINLSAHWIIDFGAHPANEEIGIFMREFFFIV